MCCINILGQTLELFVSWSCFILKLLKILKSQDHLFLAWKPKTNLNIHRKIWSHIWALSISHFLDKKSYPLPPSPAKHEADSFLARATHTTTYMYLVWYAFCTLAVCQKKKKMNLFCFSCNWKRKWKYISAVDLIVYRVVSRRKKILNKLTQICEVYLRNVSINLNLNNISSLSIINNNVKWMIILGVVDYHQIELYVDEFDISLLKGQNSVLEKRY